MIAWNSSKTKELNSSGKQSGLRCFSGMSIANQLFSVLIRLRLGLLVADVCVHFKISESMYCRLFTTWICFLSKELRLLFPFPTHQQVDNWMPRSFQKHIPNTRIIIDCECQQPSGLMVMDHLSAVEDRDVEERPSEEAENESLPPRKKKKVH